MRSVPLARTMALTLPMAIPTIAALFPMAAIRTRYAREHGLTDTVALKHERELKRYLALAALNPSKRYGMAGPVDGLWHTFITYTKDYEQFCHQVAGRFIHHVPVSDDATPNPETYNTFLTDYERQYGEPAPFDVWPRLHANLRCGTVCEHDGVRPDCQSCGIEQ